MTICTKMDLVLNNLQRLICRKTQTTNQPVLHPNQDITGSFLRRSPEYQICFSNKDTLIEILTFFNPLWEIPRIC